jgi:transposase
MMGRQNAPEKLFYQFRLEDHVPADHPLRQLDAVLNFDQTRTVLAGHYSPIGRPSIDPELMLRVLLVGYAYGIRSERQLCNEVHLNLAYRWFCRLGLEGAVPDHSTFSKTATAGLARATSTACCLKRSSNNAAKLASCPARASRLTAVLCMATLAAIGASKPSM